MSNTDVIIVGNGISGLVLSILLKEKGIDHIILARTDKRKTIALSETLPPSALSLLASLNLLELFEKSSSKSFGYHSLWGSNAVTDNNFFFHHPFKYGLKINKEVLLNHLTEKASNNIINFNSLSKFNCSPEKVIIELDQGNKSFTVTGKIIVDATGRNRAVLKKLNIPIKSYDKLIASICHIPLIKHPKLKHKVFVESFKNGWGIISARNEQTNVISIFTKKGNPILPLLKDYKNWESVLSETKILKHFLSKEPDRKVVGRDANSSKPLQASGSNWLAIGDAAISFDPLSSHGISNAIYCANASATAIESHLQNNSILPFQNYDHTISQIFDEYLKQKSRLYDTEKRWKENTFWKNSPEKIKAF